MTEPDARPDTFKWLSELLEDPELLEPPRPVVPRLVWKERITLLAAREKGGKSTLASAAAAAVSSGQNFLGAPCVPGNVLIISLEEHAADFVQRLVGFGADPDRIAVLDAHDSDLVKAIWKTADYVTPDLIVWDTLGAFASRVTGKPLEPNDSQGWTLVMNEILAVAREHGATLLLHHSKKSDGKYRDSTAIGANVDAILEMYGEGTEPRTIKGVGRFPIEETRIKLQDGAFSLVETEKQLQERVHRFIAKNPKCSFNEVRDALGGRHADIVRARDFLVKNGAITNVGRGQMHSYVAVVIPE